MSAPEFHAGQAVLTAVVHVTRKATGLTETYTLTGHMAPQAGDLPVQTPAGGPSDGPDHPDTTEAAAP